MSDPNAKTTPSDAKTGHSGHALDDLEDHIDRVGRRAGVI